MEFSHAPENQFTFADMTISTWGLINFESGSCLAWSPDNQFLAVTNKNTIWVYDVRNLSLPPVLLDGHTDVISRIVFSPNSLILTSVSHDGTVRLWNSISRKLIVTLPISGYQLQSACFSADGRFIVVGGAENVLDYWSSGILAVLDVYNETSVARIETSRGISCVLFGPNGNEVIYAALDCQIYLWELGKQQEIMLFEDIPQEEGDQIIAMRISGDGSTLSSVSLRSKCINRSLIDHTQHVLQLSNLYIRNADFAPRSNIIAYGNTPAWYPAETISEDDDVRYTNEGQLMVVQSEYTKTVCLWVWMSETSPIFLPGHRDDDIRAVAWSADGQRLASADSSSIRLWHIKHKILD